MGGLLLGPPGRGVYATVSPSPSPSVPDHKDEIDFSFANMIIINHKPALVQLTIRCNAFESLLEMEARQKMNRLID